LGGARRHYFRFTRDRIFPEVKPPHCRRWRGAMIEGMILDEGRVRPVSARLILVNIADS
jgi:hypothetical protein